MLVQQIKLLKFLSSKNFVSQIFSLWKNQIINLPWGFCPNTPGAIFVTNAGSWFWLGSEVACGNKWFIMFCTVGETSCFLLGGLDRLFCELLEFVDVGVGIRSFSVCRWGGVAVFERVTGYIVPSWNGKTYLQNRLFTYFVRHTSYKISTSLTGTSKY